MHITYCLRTSDSNRQGYGGFQWPALGPISAPDWDPEPICGGGLHGFPRGEGDWSLASWESDAIWQVFATPTEHMVELVGKIKTPRAWVVYSGTLDEAVQIIQMYHPNVNVIGGTASAL